MAWSRPVAAMHGGRQSTKHPRGRLSDYMVFVSGQPATVGHRVGSDHPALPCRVRTPVKEDIVTSSGPLFSDPDSPTVTSQC